MKRKSTFKSLLALALAVVLVFSTNITPASAAKKKALKSFHLQVQRKLRQLQGVSQLNLL